jgi:hypothetical protein
MTELNYAFKACEMPEDDFVYLAEDVDALLGEKEKRIKALESIAYSVQSADLCYGSYTTYEIYEDTVYKAKEILGE